MLWLPDLASKFLWKESKEKKEYIIIIYNKKRRKKIMKGIYKTCILIFMMRFQLKKIKCLKNEK